MAYHNRMAFSTKDRDNDQEDTINCAERYHGGWWYKSCHQVHVHKLILLDSMFCKTMSAVSSVLMILTEGLAFS